MQRPIKLLEVKCSNLATNHPAWYYGRPDGNVYVLFARGYSTPKGRQKIEYCIAEVRDSSFDYKNNKVYKNGRELKRNIDGWYLELDSPDINSNIRIRDKTRQIQSVNYDSVENWFVQNKKLPMIRTK